LNRPLNGGHNAVATLNKSVGTITSQAVVVVPVPGAILATRPRRVSATLVVPHGPAASWHQTNSPWSIG